MGAPGFDDAPLVTIQQGRQAKPLTFIYPYYENPIFLERQIDHWNSYAADLLEYLQVHVVDDGSPQSPAEAVLNNEPRRFALRLFRIAIDVRWNWLAARNIGMHHAGGWCLLTDMDHMVPDATLRSILFGSFSYDAIYRFQRREASGAVIHPHPNSMLMTSKTFWHVGGYDEALSGHYGTDGDWRRRCAATRRVYTLPWFLERHEYEDDSSTMRYKRKQPEDAGKKAIIAKRGPGWRPKVLSFPYTEVALA